MARPAVERPLVLMIGKVRAAVCPGMPSVAWASKGIVLALQQEVGVVPTQRVVEEERRCRGVVQVDTPGPGGVRGNGRAGNVIRQVVGRRDSAGRAGVGPLEVERHVQLVANGLIDLDGGDIGHTALVEGRQIIGARLPRIRTQRLRYQRQDLDGNRIKAATSESGCLGKDSGRSHR